MDRFVDELPLLSATATLAFVDVVESVHLICNDERPAVQRIRALLAEAAREVVARHQGWLIERRGDGLLLRFEHPRQALRCAQGLHRLAAANTAAHGAEPPLQLRIGLHCANLLTDLSAVYGVGVNLTARIAAFSLPGDTVMSATVRDRLTPGLDPEVQDLGECYLKHFEAPVRLFKLLAKPAELPPDLQTAIAARLRLRPTLVILPAQDAAADAQAVQPIGWADIVTDQLSRQFSQSPMLHVISALSANALRGRQIDRGHLYRHWHANYVLQSRLISQGDGAACATSTSATGVGGGRWSSNASRCWWTRATGPARKSGCCPAPACWRRTTGATPATSRCCAARLGGGGPVGRVGPARPPAT